MIFINNSQSEEFLINILLKVSKFSHSRMLIKRFNIFLDLAPRPNLYRCLGRSQMMMMMMMMMRSLRQYTCLYTGPYSGPYTCPVYDDDADDDDT